MKIINKYNCTNSHSKSKSKAKQSKPNKMSSYKSQPLSINRSVQRKTSSATQTLLSLYLGPKVHIDLVLQVQSPEMKREEQERREKVKQAKKEEQEKKEREEKEKREKETASLKKFSTGYKMPPRNYG